MFIWRADQIVLRVRAAYPAAHHAVSGMPRNAGRLPMMNKTAIEYAILTA